LLQERAIITKCQTVGAIIDYKNNGNCTQSSHFNLNNSEVLIQIFIVSNNGCKKIPEKLIELI
jgi:hypothetical protein